ncbi:Palmitoyltransferase zdhhc14, variant 3 [Dermatophagoides farinae]|uniref:Palmitoyltransferase zdhhc14, variant 3 n=1 Tax=Dermatophagoides farinae TaxID=6954 RepID=A0A922HVD9_DERFA|nr:Palmitoyltransferase zdhhc14, variant 3 [Dermatophagoides farinae]
MCFADILDFSKCFNRNRNQHHHCGRYYSRKNHGQQLEPYRHSINNVRTQSINLDDENEPDDVIIDILDDRPLTYFVFPMGNKTISPATPPSPRLVTFKMADSPKRRLYRPLRRYRQKLTTIVEMGSNEI